MNKPLPSATQAQVDRAVRAARNVGLEIDRIVVEGNRVEVIVATPEPKPDNNQTHLLRIPKA